MVEKDILMEIYSKVERIDERTELHGRQIGTIFSMLNSGGCATGKQNATTIKWIWTVVCLGGVCIMGVIGFFHLS